MVGSGPLPGRSAGKGSRGLVLYLGLHNALAENGREISGDRIYAVVVV